MKHRLSLSTHRRSGITLTQMLVVMALTSVITTSAISLVITMMRLEGNTIQVWMTQRTFLQLSQDFRKDAHAAQFAEITQQNELPVLIFRNEPKSVTYVATVGQVTRRETDGDKLLRTETYRIPESNVWFERTGSSEDPPRIGTGQSVRMTCRRPNQESINRRTTAPRHDERIVAVVGRDHRFEKPGSK